MKNRTTTSLYYENTTVILTEVGHLFTSSLRVTQDTKHIGDFYRDIEIYQRDSSCSDLPTLRQTPPITQYGTDISAINGTTFYALPGSSVTYNICAITNYTTTELERLELLLHKGSLSQPIAIDFFHVGTNEKWQCKESTLHFDKPAYYVITFLPPTHEATFMFNATYDVREIDTEQLYETATANHTLRNDEDTSEFDNLKFSNTYSCFVATIKDNPHTLKQTVHIRLQHSMQKWLFIIGGLVIFAFLVGTLVLSAIILCCLCLFNKGCTTRF